MKLNADKIAEAAAWVEAHGLHPQACGASIGDFCKAMGIAERTAYLWLKNAEFADAIAQARAKYAATVIRDVENALVKAALGVDAEVTKEKAKAIDEVVREYDPATGALIRETKTKKLVTMEAVRERRYFPPDVNAAKFVLTNMDPEKWKNKAENTVRTPDAPLNITVGSQEALEGLRHALDTGAKPAPPETPAEE